MLIKNMKYFGLEQNKFCGSYKTTPAIIPSVIITAIVVSSVILFILGLKL